MDNENTPDMSRENDWLDDILEPQELPGELGPDENAVFSAGLTAPNEAKVDSIVEEVSHIDWDNQPDDEVTSQQPFTQEEFQDTFGENGEGLAAVFEDAPVPAEEALPEEEAADEEAFAEEPAEEAAEEAAPVRKRRPRRKKGYGLFGIPHLIATAVWLVIIVAIGVSLGRIAWVCAADLLAFGREEKVVTFTINDDDTIDTIADKLKEDGLIRYPQLFKFYIDLTDSEEEISTGTFQLNTLYDYHALVNSMSADAEGRQEVEITIPEGYSCAQIFALLEEEGVCTAAELEAYAADGELNEYWFLEGVERGSKYCLEGYLFPDTYKFYTNDEPRNALEKLLDGFDYRFTDKMKENIALMNEKYAQMMTDKGYDEAYIASHKITIREIVIIASMIEKETAGGSDSNKIASVIYNRLTNPEFPLLQVDATIVYALGGKTDPLTLEDLQLDSPYNTYISEGLPPGPISNPGRHSLYAALEPYPENTEEDYYSFYYYAYDPDAGEHHYSATFEEHKAFLSTLEE